MLSVKNEISSLLKSAVSGAFPFQELTQEELCGMLEYPPDREMGDLAFPCFKLSKTLRSSPMVICSKIVENLEKTPSELIEKINPVGGYLNFKLSTSALAQRLLPEMLDDTKAYGSSNIGEGKTVVLDYSSPNICKPFHIGHLGSTIIGHSIRKIHEFCGYRCIGINHLGDWGTQFGKQIVAYRKWGDKETVEKGGVDELVKLYVRFHEEAEKDPSLNDLARNEFHKLETGDPENLALWKWFVEISVREFKTYYEKLGVEFDSYAGESFYTDKMAEQVELLREKGLLKIDQGASVVDLEAYGMPPCLILKTDGSTLYPTRDIAAAAYRARTYHFDKCVYITSSQQCLHFKQWFQVVSLMGYDWASKLVHVPYGTVSINGEKLATRSGNVILIKDLIKASVDKVRAIMEEKNPDLPDMDRVAEEVGVGAIVFNYLFNSRIKDINFVLEDALSFDGNTGPYAQYTHARCCSILSKGKEPDAKSSAVTAPEERELLLTLSLFPEKTLNALETYEPSVITRYVIDVCVAFNRFYHECPIWSAGDPATVALRLSLTRATKNILESAMHLICMKTPDKI